MANTFFGFNTSLNEHDRLGSSPDDLEGLEPDEEEYDALNDETFGGLGSDLGDDWEEQHEQLAEIAESSRHSFSENLDQNIESFLDHLGLDDEDNLEKRDKSVWEYNSNDAKNGENHFLNNSNKVLTNHFQNDKQPALNQILFPGQAQRTRLPSPQQLPKVQTLEEIERMLISQSKSVQNNNAPNNVPNNQQFQQQHGQLPIPPRFPPGFQPVVLPPNLPHHPGPPPPVTGPGPHPQPPMGWPPHGGQFPPNLPPGLMRVMGPHNRVPPPHVMGPPPGFPHYHHPNNAGGNFPVNPHFNFPPPPRLQNQNMNNQNQRQQPQQNQQQQQQHQQQQQQQQQQNQHQQKSRSDHHQHRHNKDHHGSGDTKDEYAGLMVNREKQWLLNIQLLQVNTGTPYFDDYYYTVFKERQAKNNKENQSQNANSNNQNYHQHHNGGNRNHHHHHREDNHHRQGHDRDRNRQDKEQENPLKGKIYTPLQFENSLGKLQFASVTAPRKIIDMDIINLEKDSDSPQATRDSRKTRQLLIELESMYSLLLRAEDLKNPLAISNAEKLKELKQKQRLREIEAAPTPEQKQEVLKLLQQESMAVVENHQDLLNKIVQQLLQEEKFYNFVAIRKGKMLLLRLLPQLSYDVYSMQILEIWTKLLHSISLIGRRDTMGDNILPRFHPLFKRFINTCEMNKILEIVLSLRETVKLENSRSTPLSHQSKSPLHFVLTNKFGITSLASIIVRVEAIADLCSEKQLSEWSSFLSNLSETISALGTSVAHTLEPIATQIITKHTSRFKTLSQDRKSLIVKVFADTD